MRQLTSSEETSIRIGLLDYKQSLERGINAVETKDPELLSAVAEIDALLDNLYGGGHLTLTTIKEKS